jgi:hypothetical protein
LLEEPEGVSPQLLAVCLRGRGVEVERLVLLRWYIDQIRARAGAGEHPSLLLRLRSRIDRAPELLLDDTDEDLQRLGPRERSPVHEDSRHAGNADSSSLIEIRLHRWAMDAFRHAALELHTVEAHLGRVPLQVLRVAWGMGE